MQTDHPTKCTKTDPEGVLERIGTYAVKNYSKVVVTLCIIYMCVGAIVTVKTITSYFKYAAIVDARLADSSLIQPAGIYSSRGRLIPQQRVKVEEVVRRLVRAGYDESANTSEFSSGGFSVEPNAIEVRTNRYVTSDDLPAVVRIKFESDRIRNIEDSATGQQLKAIHLPAEMLTADINAKKQTREAINFDELPPVLVDAVSSIEDRRFFEHPGIDVMGMGRALFANIGSGRIRQGGSTITQQLIKSQFLSPARTYTRKFIEVMMSLAIERRLTKRQIFALYCSKIYLGHSGNTSIYGFKRAAMMYFGKELRDLSLSEAAFLAGMAQAPNRYSLHSRPEYAIERRNVVLDAMTASGKITAVEAASAKRDEPAFLPPQKLDDTAAPHFVDYLKRELGREQFEEGDWPHLRIETTLDLDLQQAANQAVKRQLDRLDKMIGKQKQARPPEVALVALDPHSGEILAMVGGRDYADSQLNRATDALRQPGSVFKPIVYAAALSSGLSPATTFMNARHDIEYADHAVYRPENFRGSYTNQQVTLREGIVRSLNVVAVDAAMRVGLGRVADMAERVGLPRPQAYPSMALGAFEATPLQIARAYSAFANNGTRVDPFAIRTIKNNDEVLLTGSASKGSVLSPSLAYIVTDTLAEVVNRGTAASIRSLGYKGPAAGKTGTSKDSWFVGYTPNLLVVVWVGYDDNHDLRLTGSEAAVPIWTDFVVRAMEIRPDLAANDFGKPSGLHVVEIDPDTGLLAVDFCPRRQRVLVSGGLVPRFCHHQDPSLVFAEYEPGLDMEIAPDADVVDLPVLPKVEMARRELPEPVNPTLPSAPIPKSTPMPLPSQTGPALPLPPAPKPSPIPN